MQPYCLIFVWGAFIIFQLNKQIMYTGISNYNRIGHKKIKSLSNDTSAVSSDNPYIHADYNGNTDVKVEGTNKLPCLKRHRQLLVLTYDWSDSRSFC